MCATCDTLGASFFSLVTLAVESSPFCLVSSDPLVICVSLGPGNLIELEPSGFVVVI